MINIGIIGYGYWGPNLVRNFAELSRAKVTAVADLDPKRLELVTRRFPNVKTTTNCQELIRDPKIDAIAIATPVITHFELGMAALKAGKHVWLEKPMTETSLQASKLVDEADKRKRCSCTSTTRSSTPAPCARWATSSTAATWAASTTTTRSA